jgi:hypothetical protein
MNISKLSNKYNQENTFDSNDQQPLMGKKSASFGKRIVSSDGTHKDKSTIDNLAESRSMSKQPAKTVNKNLERVKKHYTKKSHYTREMIGLPKHQLPASKDISEASYLPDRKDILGKSYAETCSNAIRNFKEAKISEENLFSIIKYCHDNCLNDAKIIAAYKDRFTTDRTAYKIKRDNFDKAMRIIDQNSLKNESESNAIKNAVYQFLSLPSVSNSKRHEAYKLIPNNPIRRVVTGFLQSLINPILKDNKIVLPLAQAAENINFASFLLNEIQTYASSQKSSRTQQQWTSLIETYQKNVQETAENITKKLCEDPVNVLKIEKFIDLIQDESLRSECKKIPERMNLDYKNLS